jgi:hypothetical protein
MRCNIQYDLMRHCGIKGLLLSLFGRTTSVYLNRSDRLPMPSLLPGRAPLGSRAELELGSWILLAIDQFDVAPAPPDREGEGPGRRARRPASPG